MTRRHKIGTVRCQGRDLAQRVKEQLGGFEEMSLGFAPAESLPTERDLDLAHMQLWFVTRNGNG